MKVISLPLYDFVKKDKFPSILKKFPGKTSTNFYEVEEVGRRVSKPVIGEYTDIGKLHCASLCSKHNSCASFSHSIVAKSCYLHHVRDSEPGVQYVTDSTFTIYS